MKYHFKYYEDGPALWAECIELPGCMTRGGSLDNLIAMASDALNVYLDEPIRSAMPVGLPDPALAGPMTIEARVDPCIAFRALFRSYRLAKGLSPRALARLAGLGPPFGYRRLARRVGPTLADIALIRERLPDFRLDLLLD